MPATAARKVIYRSRHRYSVDSNRRVQFPPEWRTAKPEELTMILWKQQPEFGACLRVLPPDELEKLRQKIETMPAPQKTALKRVIGGASAKVELDSAKRMPIPLDMAKEAGISDEAVFNGMMDYLEIWNPSRHEAIDKKDQQVVNEILQTFE